MITYCSSIHRVSWLLSKYNILPVQPLRPSTVQHLPRKERKELAEAKAKGGAAAGGATKAYHTSSIASGGKDCGDLVGQWCWWWNEGWMNECVLCFSLSLYKYRSRSNHFGALRRIGKRDARDRILRCREIRLILGQTKTLVWKQRRMANKKKQNLQTYISRSGKHPSLCFVCFFLQYDYHDHHLFLLSCLSLLHISELMWECNWCLCWMHILFILTYNVRTAPLLLSIDVLYLPVS